jgi:hypothetical protein
LLAEESQICAAVSEVPALHVVPFAETAVVPLVVMAMNSPYE